MKTRIRRINKTHKSKSVFIGIMLLVFTGCVCNEKIPSNQAIIFIDNNIALNKVKTKGCLPDSTKHHFEIYETSLQTCDIKLNCLMKDRASMTFYFSVNFYLTKEYLPNLYNKFGKDYIKMFVRPEIRAMSRNMLSAKYPNELSEEIVTNLLSDKIINNRVWSDYLKIDNIEFKKMEIK
jgi:hypothetical protein